MRPISSWALPPISTVNHSAPSGPAVMPSVNAGAATAAKLVTTPVVVMRPTMPVLPSVNQRLPSGPEVIP